MGKTPRFFTKILISFAAAFALFGVSACGGTTTVSSVTKDALAGIRIKTPPTQTEYFEGDVFQTTGLVLEAYNTSGSTYEVVGYSYSPDGPLSVSDTAITFSYQSKTTTQAITVKASNPDVVLQGKSGTSDVTLRLNRGGVAALGTTNGSWYNSGTKIFLTIDSKDYTFDQDDKGAYSVDIPYNNATVSFKSTTVSEFFFTYIVFHGAGKINGYTVEADMHIVLGKDGTVTYPTNYGGATASDGSWTKNGEAISITLPSGKITPTYEGGTYSFEFSHPYSTFTASGTVTFTPPTAFYNLSFNTDGGTAIDTRRVGNTEDIALSDLATTKENYRIKAWHESSLTGTTVEFPYHAHADMTLYVEWRAAVNYTVSFNVDGGSAIAPITKQEDSLIQADEVVTAKAGYRVKAWHKGAIDGDKVNFPLTVSEDVTLYVEWQENPIASFVDTAHYGVLDLFKDGTCEFTGAEGHTGTWTYDKTADQYTIVLESIGTLVSTKADGSYTVSFQLWGMITYTLVYTPAA